MDQKEGFELSADTPISKVEDDLLGYAPFAEQLAQAIKNFNIESTFTIALCGKWGSGKTSIINMMEERLKTSEKLMLIHFNPWNFTNSEQLINQFFAQFQEALSKTSGYKNIKKDFQEYIDLLDLVNCIPAVGNFTKVIIPIVKFKLKKRAEKKSSLQSIKERLSKALSSFQQQTVIIIDDIDRLSNDKIRMLFQLVKSVADFPKVIYLLSFDKEIVSNALTEVQKCDGAKYLDKIIQVQYDIPEIQDYKLDAIFFAKLSKIINIEKDNQKYLDSVYEYSIKPFITTVRAINKLMNSFYLKYIAIGTDVNFVDLLAITAIQLFNPTLYTWIRENQSLLLGSLSIQYFIVKDNDDEKNEVSNIIKKRFPDDSSFNCIVSILSGLFPYINRLFNVSNNVHSFSDVNKERFLCSSSSFMAYFCMSLENIKVSRSEIDNIINTYDDYNIKKTITTIKEQNLILSFFEDVKTIIVNSDLDEDRITILFHSFINLSEILSDENVFTSELKTCCDLCLELLKKINTNKFKLFNSEIQKLSETNIELMAAVLRQIEFAYGFLPKDSDVKSTNPGLQVITKQELEKTLSLYTSYLIEILKQTNVFDYKNARYTCFFINDDIDDFKSIIQEKINNDDLYICSLILKSKDLWFKFADNGDCIQKVYLNSDLLSLGGDLLTKIDTLRKTKKFWNQPEEINKEVIFFYLCFNKATFEDSRAGRITTTSLYTKWKNEYEKSHQNEAN